MVFNIRGMGFIDLPFLKMVVSHGYVGLPEGKKGENDDEPPGV